MIMKLEMASTHEDDISPTKISHRLHLSSLIAMLFNDNITQRRMLRIVYEDNVKQRRLHGQFFAVYIV